MRHMSSPGAFSKWELTQDEESQDEPSLVSQREKRSPRAWAHPHLYQGVRGLDALGNVAVSCGDLISEW